jgi:hypothetical protein
LFSLFIGDAPDCEGAESPIGSARPNFSLPYQALAPRSTICDPTTNQSRIPPSPYKRAKNETDLKKKKGKNRVSMFWTGHTSGLSTCNDFSIIYGVFDRHSLPESRSSEASLKTSAALEPFK